MNNPEKFPYQVNKWFVDSLNKKPIDFYLFVFNSVLRITDGALSEYIGQDCSGYLDRMGYVPIQYHVKIMAKANPFCPNMTYISIKEQKGEKI